MRKFILLAGLAGLACSTACWAKKERPQVAAELAATHGYVYAQAPKGGMASLSVRPEAGGAEIRFATPVGTPGRRGAQQLGYWLPPGRYRITSWQDIKQPNGPVFEIEAGRVTDLGGFVPVNIGGYQLALLPVRHQENEADAQAAIAPFSSLLKAEPIRWNAATMPDVVALPQPSSGQGLIVNLLIAHDRKINKPSTSEGLKSEKDPGAFLRLARTIMPPLQDEAAIAPDGTAWFPADLGQLRRRRPDGSWDNVGIDTLRQILAVELDGTRLLTGSDDGHLRASTDEGAHWTELKAFSRLESIIDIDHGEGTWIVVTTEAYEDPSAKRGGAWIVAAPGTPSVHMRVYTGKRDDLSDLAVSKQFELAPINQIGWLGARGKLFDGRFFVTAGNSLARLELATGNWKTLVPGPRISTHHVDRSTGMLSAFWSQGAFSKVYVSADHGETWAVIGRPPYAVYDIQMDAPDRGWASRWNMDAFSGKWETYTFVPTKNDWVQTGEAPLNCKPLRYDASAAPICITNGASIFGLRDGAWNVEFSAN